MLWLRNKHYKSITWPRKHKFRVQLQTCRNSKFWNFPRSKMCMAISRCSDHKINATNVQSILWPRKHKFKIQTCSNSKILKFPTVKNGCAHFPMLWSQNRHHQSILWPQKHRYRVPICQKPYFLRFSKFSHGQKWAWPFFDFPQGIF